MSDWPFVSAAFLSNGTGAIDGLKLTRAERGYKLRRFGKYRPVLNLNLCRAAVALLDINGDEDDDFDNVIGSIEGDAVVFSLPKVIKGQWRNFFKITRS
jgi:hypothetical protein